MKVKDLVEKLKQFDSELPILCYNDEMDSYWEADDAEFIDEETPYSNGVLRHRGVLIQ